MTNYYIDKHVLRDHDLFVFDLIYLLACIFFLQMYIYQDIITDEKERSKSSRK